MQARATELKKEYDMILSMESTTVKIMYLESECYWASVIYLEKKLKHTKKNCNMMEEKILTLKKEIKDVHHERESLKSGLE